MGGTALTRLERQALSKLGQMGGRARAKSQTAEQLTAIAMMGVEARRKKGFSGTRSNKKRCPCGVMSLKRATARGKEATHDPSCSFYGGMKIRREQRAALAPPEAAA